MNDSKRWPGLHARPGPIKRLDQLPRPVYQIPGWLLKLLSLGLVVQIAAAVVIVYRS